jgi:hypothetical protein
MIRFFVSATYRTAGGRRSQCAFPLVARDHDHARELAARRIDIRSRSRFTIIITREA